MWQHVAALVAEWGADLVGEHGLSAVGAVVGATHPRAVGEARKLMPQAIILLPGVGAQGAAPADLARAFTSGPASALVNASRSVDYAFRETGGDFRAAAGAEAARLQARDMGRLRLVAQAVRRPTTRPADAAPAASRCGGLIGGCRPHSRRPRRPARARRASRRPRLLVEALLPCARGRHARRHRAQDRVSRSRRSSGSTRRVKVDGALHRREAPPPMRRLLTLALLGGALCPPGAARPPPRCRRCRRAPTWSSTPAPARCSQRRTRTRIYRSRRSRS